MTFREFDNKCAELADAACDIGEKTLWLIIMLALAFAAMIYAQRAEAQTPAELLALEQDMALALSILNQQNQQVIGNTGGLYGNGNSLMATERVQVDPWSGREYRQQFLQVVPNDAWGRPQAPIVPLQNNNWIYEALRK